MPENEKYLDVLRIAHLRITDDAKGSWEWINDAMRVTQAQVKTLAPVAAEFSEFFVKRSSSGEIMEVWGFHGTPYPHKDAYLIYLAE